MSRYKCPDQRQEGGFHHRGGRLLLVKISPHKVVSSFLLQTTFLYTVGGEPIICNSKLRPLPALKGKAMKTRITLSLIFAFVTILGSSCSFPAGGPSINSFSLLYDIVATLDNNQGAQWDVSGTSNVDIKVTDERGNDIHSLTGLPANSNGIQQLDISSLQPGKYKVTLIAGSTTDSREFVLIDSTGGYWYSFTKYVNAPQEGPWLGFTNEIINVSHSKGLNDQDTISISERVYFRNIRWRPYMNEWADRQGCTSPGLNVLTVSQLTSSYSYDKYDPLNSATVYPFPTEWSAAGQYHNSVDWSPCNFGWEGDTQTIKRVAFTLELEALER